MNCIKCGDKLMSDFTDRCYSCSQKKHKGRAEMNEALALAKEGMELHECNAPEYIVCAAVIRQQAEIERLRSALEGFVKNSSRTDWPDSIFDDAVEALGEQK